MERLFQILSLVFLFSCGENEPETEEGKFLYKNYKGANFIETTCRPLPEINMDLDSVLHGLSEDHPRYEEVQEMLLNAKENKQKLFPSKTFDRVVLVMLNPVHGDKISQADIHDISFLCYEKVWRMLEIINNPINYSDEVCKGNLVHSLLRFHKGDEIVAEIQFSCHFETLAFKPSNKMALKSLNHRGDSLLKSLKILH